jgi:hypothetical protein
MDAARALGRNLAGNGCSIVYGGGSQGLMGALADGALAQGGEVIGVLPKFMADLEWGHPGLTHLDLVEDMRERKHKLLTGSDAVVALPAAAARSRNCSRRSRSSAWACTSTRSCCSTPLASTRRCRPSCSR